MSKRTDAVKDKLFKIRKARMENKKIEKETFRLKRETDRISNKGFTIKNPIRVIGAFVPVETDIAQDTLVSYKYAGKQEYAKVLNNNTLLLIDDPGEEYTIQCIFKNGRLRTKKTLDNTDKEVIMVE